MSRIQHILEKAEREGGVRRLRSITPTEPAGATLAVDVPLVAPAAVEEIAPPPEVTVQPDVRTVRVHFDRALVAALEPGAMAAEQYRALRTRLTHADHGAPVAALLVTSPGRGEGKSVTAANLALTMSQDLQSRICVVDGDLRHSSLHQLFGIPETPGLADVLAGRADLADALVALEDHALTVLPAGQRPAHPAELLGSTAMRRLLQTLRSRFDRVIVDAPAAAPLADVGILTPLVDSVVLVVHAGATTKPAIQEAVDAIGASKVLGVVLNGAAAA